MKLEDLTGVAIVFVVLAVLLGIGSTVLENVEEITCENTPTMTYLNNSCFNTSNTTYYEILDYSFNATREGVEGLDELASWQSTLAVIVVAAVIIGVIGYFYSTRR